MTFNYPLHPTAIDNTIFLPPLVRVEGVVGEFGSFVKCPCMLILLNIKYEVSYSV